MFEVIKIDKNFFTNLKNLDHFCSTVRSTLEKEIIPVLDIQSDTQSDLFDFEDELFENSFDTLVHFFSTLSSLQKQVSIAIVHNSCSDYFLDLALNCKYVFYCGKSRFIQMHYRERGDFPWLGGLLRYNTVFNKDVISGKRKIYLDQLVDSRIIDYWAECSITKNLGKMTRFAIKQVPYSAPSFSKNLNHLLQSKELEFQESFFKSGLRLIASNRLTQSNKELALLFLATKYFFHKKSYSRRLGVKYRLQSSSHGKFSNFPQIGRIFVNLEFLCPSEFVIQRILNQGLKIVFINANDFQINLVGVRIQSNPLAQTFWNQSIFWSTERIQTNEPLLEWQTKELLTLHYDGFHYNYRILPENRWLETHNLSGMEETFSLGAILTKASPKQTFLSEIIVGFFFEELFRFSTTFKGGISRALKALSACGWTTVCDESFWERYLRIRGPYHQDLRIGSLCIDPQYWEMEVWKVALKSSDKFRRSQTLEYDDEYVSLHFALYCGILSQILFNSGLLVHPKQADLFIAESCGFPLRYGLPRHSLEAGGKLKLRYYQEKYWPWMSK